jgi:hypothetical protein
MVFVTTADGSKGLAAVSYDQMKDNMRGAIRDLRDQLEEVDVLAGSGADSPGDTATAESEAPATESDTPDGLLAESQEWTNANGQPLVAAIKKVEGGQVHFLMPNGTMVPYPIENLSAESRARVEALSGE